LTPQEAHDQLGPLLGSDLGTGDWVVLSDDRIARFNAAASHTGQEAPMMLLVSLLPGLTSSIKLPIDPPQTSVNYGLDASRLVRPVRPGERVRARAALLAIEDGGRWLQLKRRVVLEDEAGQPVLEVDTLTRLYW
jgi:hypothetical protein